MLAEIYNGVVLPDGTRHQYTPIEGVHVADLKTINHPAFVARGSKGLFADVSFAADDYIGSYGGKIIYFKDDLEEDVSSWNPYQLTPDPNGNYYIDGLEIGNELRYCNDPKGTDREPNARFYQSDVTIGDFFVCDVHAIRDIAPGEEILISYGDGYWEMFQIWYENNNPFECPHCDYRTDTSKKRNSHKYRVHEDDSPTLELECSYCDRVFTAENSRDIHVNSEHTQKTLLTCSQKSCKYTTYSPYSLRAHKRKVHLQHHYKCFQCDINFTSKNALDGHLSALHSDKTYPCTQCNLVFKYTTGLSKHIKIIHKGIRSHRCDICNNTFTAKANLESHIIAVHKKEKPHKCQQCSESFSIIYNLVRHVKSVHDKIRDHACDQCDKMFSTSSDLHRHMERHKEELDYVCNICDKSFKTKASLTRHIDVHNDERKHKCSICDWSFKEIGNLRRHERNIHKEFGKINPKKPPKAKRSIDNVRDNAMKFEIVIEVEQSNFTQHKKAHIDSSPDI